MKRDDQAIAKAARSAAEGALNDELELLKKLCSFDCASGNEEGNAKIAEVVDEALKTIDGIEIEHVYAPGDGFHVLGRLKPEHPTGRIILNAHLDTVFQNVSVADYPFHIDGDMAYGLGSGDCKGGVVVAITAVRLAQKLGLLPQKEIVFMFNCDEEVSSTGSGYRFFDLALPADEVYVFEGTGQDGNLCIQRKCGCRFKVDVTGVRAHSASGYMKGRSAVVELAHRILRLYENNDNERGVQFNFGELNNDDPMNVVSGHAWVTGSVRVANQEDVKVFLDAVARVEAEPPYLEGTQTKITVNTSKTALLMERNERNAALFETIRQAGALLGQDLAEKPRAGFGDVCYFNSKGCACVDGLGPWSMRAHSSDEHIYIPSLVERTALFLTVLGRME